MRTYRDPDGKLRHDIDGGALAIVGQLAVSSPIAADVARNWSAVDNPSMRAGFTGGLAEGLLRYTGLMKYSPHNPGVSKKWEILEKGRDIGDLVHDVERQTEVRP